MSFDVNISITYIDTENYSNYLTATAMLTLHLLKGQINDNDYFRISGQGAIFVKSMNHWTIS